MTEAMMALATLEGGGALKQRGLFLPSDITLDRYVAVLRLLGDAGDKVQWAKGDALAFGEDVFPEEHSQAWEDAGYTASEMQHIRVSRAIPLDDRRFDLSWSHYRTVYTLEAETRDNLLQRAVNEGWTRDQLADAKTELGGSQNGSGVLPQPSKQYVMERVCNAAEAAWRSAERDGEFFKIPVDQFAALGEALGAGSDY